MRNNGAVDNDTLSSFWDHIGHSHVIDEYIRIAIRRAVITLQLDRNENLPSRVGMRSFW